MNPDFRPLPLLGNPHVQTVLANLLPNLTRPPATQEHRVVLPDGDQLVLHDSRPDTWHPGDPVVLLVHGLGGCHASPYLVRCARRLTRRGWRAVRMDLRGCGKGIAWARKLYNGGCSEDLRAAAAYLHCVAPASPLALIGFSLGGNIVLKTAGECSNYPVPGLACVAAVAAPIDLERCSALIALPRNRLYERYYVQRLIRHVQRQQSYFPDLPPVTFPKSTTLLQFDEWYTAPRGGYASARDYYHRASSGPLVPHIAVPALLLTARDDPFISPESFERLATPPSVEIRILPHGGHLGFLGWDGEGGIRWAERQVVEWVVQVVSRQYPASLLPSPE